MLVLEAADPGCSQALCHALQAFHIPSVSAYIFIGYFFKWNELAQSCFLFAHFQGSLETFSGLGLALGPPLGGFLYQSFGYELPFIFLGCFVLLMVPFNMCILPNYGKSAFIACFETLTFEYAFVGDQFTTNSV